MALSLKRRVHKTILMPTVLYGLTYKAIMKHVEKYTIAKMRMLILVLRLVIKVYTKKYFCL